MLDQLQKQGWTVERENNGVITIFGCFDDGFWCYIYISPAEIFIEDYKNDPAFLEKADMGDMRFAITSLTTHRMTNPYDISYFEGKTKTYDEALQIAYDACQEKVERFDAFCED